MKKYENTVADIQKIIDCIAENDTEAILSGIKSDIPILNLNAIIFGTKYNYQNNEFINTIKEKFINSNVSFLGTELRCFALASLHLLRTKKYVGTDKTIIRLIDSKFDF